MTVSPSNVIRSSDPLLCRVRSISPKTEGSRLKVEGGSLLERPETGAKPYSMLQSSLPILLASADDGPEIAEWPHSCIYPSIIYGYGVSSSQFAQVDIRGEGIS
jgi:hypothetical protein